MFEYRIGNDLDVDEIIAIYRSSTLAERRPIGDRARMSAMLERANLVVTAWDGSRPIGIARSLSDFCYATYLADLVVHSSYQRRGIGRELIRRTQQAGGLAAIHLFAAPGATEYYPRLGFTNRSGWLLKPDDPLR
jgi:predicted N-acetyltransferase YhbS